LSPGRRTNRGVNVVACFAGCLLCNSLPPFYRLHFTAAKYTCWPIKSNLAARIGLSLACMDFPSPGRPGRVNDPDLMLRLPQHTSFEPVRFLAPSLSFSGRGLIDANNPLSLLCMPLLTSTSAAAPLWDFHPSGSATLASCVRAQWKPLQRSLPL
jgi:hypothetical protein